MKKSIFTFNIKTLTLSFHWGRLGWDLSVSFFDPFVSAVPNNSYSVIVNKVSKNVLEKMDKDAVEAIFRKTSKFLKVSTDHIFYLPKDISLDDEENAKITDPEVLDEIREIFEEYSPTIEILEKADEIDIRDYEDRILALRVEFEKEREKMVREAEREREKMAREAEKEREKMAQEAAREREAIVLEFQTEIQIIHSKYAGDVLRLEQKIAEFVREKQEEARRREEEARRREEEAWRLEEARRRCQQNCCCFWKCLFCCWCCD